MFLLSPRAPLEAHYRTAFQEINRYRLTIAGLHNCVHWIAPSVNEKWLQLDMEHSAPGVQISCVLRHMSALSTAASSWSEYVRLAVVMPFWLPVAMEHCPKWYLLTSIVCKHIHSLKVCKTHKAILCQNLYKKAPAVQKKRAHRCSLQHQQPCLACILGCRAKIDLSNWKPNCNFSQLVPNCDFS